MAIIAYVSKKRIKVVFGQYREHEGRGLSEVATNGDHALNMAGRVGLGLSKSGGVRMC